MLWNNVESKPYGFYPLSWDLKLLDMLGGQDWVKGVYKGQTLFEAAPPGQRVLGWRPEERDYAYPNIGEDDCAGKVDHGLDLQVPHLSWFFYLARICNHCTYPACLASCPRGSIYKRPEDGIVLLDQGRCRGYRECVQACPYKKTFPNPMTGTSEKCIACYPKIEQGLQPQCFVNCIGKIRLAGWLSKPEDANPQNPIDYLVHIRRIAKPLYPQFGLEPNVYYIPPVHAPQSFLYQMFGPGAAEAVRTYRAAASDADLYGLLSLFGCSERIMPRWKRTGEVVSGLDESGEVIVRVPLREPVHIRQPFDAKHHIARTNCP